MMEGISALSDDELLVLIKQDKLSAFKELYSRYWKKLYAEAYKRLNSKELAEEIVQELFTNLWLQRHVRQINSTIGGYLYSTVTNRVIDQYRKEIVRNRHREAMMVAHSEADTTTEDAIMLRDLTYAIETEVSLLPDKCRQVYELSRNEYKSNKEIALMLGISEKTVENHLTKALKRLRVGLGHYLPVIALVLLK
jgi:RNA polymerase sigma-70 factor (ECF subfamily)